MGGITSGIGIFSGINTAQLIDQLMAVEARPKQLIQNRILQLQLQSGAYLDLNTRLQSIRNAAQAFRLNSTFDARRAVSSDANVLGATAGNSASPGTYTFIVDRLVSTQQQLSRGFSDSDRTGLGLSSMTFESALARLDRDVALSDLNDGAGVQRGRIVVTDSASNSATIDLSRATTVQEALDAINGNGTAHVTASVSGGRLVIADNAGGTITVANAPGSTTATGLGVAGSGSGQVTGSVVYRLHGLTSLSALNDGAGVSIRHIAGTSPANLTITVDSTPVRVYLGEVRDADGTVTRSAAATVQDAVDRINEALAAAEGEGDITEVVASIDATNGRLVLTDTSGTQTLTVTEGAGGSTAADLGLMVSQTGATISGRRILAGLNTTLARGLNGGSGLSGDGVLNFTARDGHAFAVTIDTTASLSDIFAQVRAASGTGANGQPRISLALDSNGTGITVSDNTGGSGNLIITGTPGSDTAASLAIATAVGGVASATVSSGNLQRRYISAATALADLNAGRGVGTGTIRITDPSGAIATVIIGTNQRTVGDLIDQINAAGLKARARINAQGDGVEVYEDLSQGPAGPVKIKIEDASGSVAANLNLRGEASGTGGQNVLDGTYERRVTFNAADTLQQIVTKINSARPGATASIIRDGSGATPFRLNLSAAQAGLSGRFIVDAQGADLAWQSLDAGQNSRAFFGSTDAARGVVLGGSTNAIDGAVAGLRLDLLSPSEGAVTVTVSTDSQAIETAVNAFVTAINGALERVDSQSRYDAESRRGGPLLGDSTTIELKQAIYSLLQGAPIGVSGRYQRLAEVGITVGQGGRVQFNADTFRAAMNADPQAVKDLFAARVQTDDSQIEIEPGVFVRNPNAGSSFSSLGMMGRFEQLVTRYIDTSEGVLTRRAQGISGQVAQQNDRIAAIDVRLTARRQQLQTRFAAMERAIQQLQGQQSALGSLGSISLR